MSMKLKIIKSFKFEETKLIDKSFKYSPAAAKNMIAHGENEIVFFSSEIEDTGCGLVWIKEDTFRYISSPEAKDERDIWKEPVILSCNEGVMLLCPATKKLWMLTDINAEWKEIEVEDWPVNAIPMKIAVCGENGKFPIVCRCGNSLEATNSFAILSVDFASKKAQWIADAACVYANESIRQKHLDAIERADGKFDKVDFNYQTPMIGSITEEDGHIYGFLEGNIINPAGMGVIGYYWFLEISKTGIFIEKIWGRDNLSRLKGKHGVRGKISGDRKWLIISPIFKTDEWKGKQKLIKIEDNEVIDFTMPRGCSSYRLIDIWGNHAFINDEAENLAICNMEA